MKSLIPIWFLLFGLSSCFIFGQSDYLEFKGKVIDAQTGKSIPEVHLSVQNTNISTLANNQGEFTIKVPEDQKEAVIGFFKIDYKTKSVQFTFFNKDYTEITLQPEASKAEKLDEVALYYRVDPREIVEKAIHKADKRQEKLIGFYREKIDKSRRNVMLGEAVIQIDQEKWTQGTKGEISVFKSRKRTDYKRLDTLAVKLRGGPYSGLYLDLASYPEFLFFRKDLSAFNFSFEESTIIEGNFVFVIDFEQIDKSLPWYYGRLFIDAKTNSFIKVDYNLNVDDKRAAAAMLVVKKPGRARVTPLEVNYKAEYIEKDGIWYFNYGQFFIRLRVNWRGKLFNSQYAIQTEMAVTNRGEQPFFDKKQLKRIKPSVVMSDDILGFEDPEFWGAQNVIQPDKNIREIIESIQDKIK